MIEVIRKSEASTERLWEVMSDVRLWPRWLPTVDAVTPLDPPAVDGVGSAYRVEQPGLPRAVWTITALEPDRSFTWESTAPGIRTVGTHELHAGPDGSTTIVLGISWSGPLAGVMRLALGRKARTNVEIEAEALDAVASESRRG